ncbi:hypothetical protein DXX97_01785 [Lactococcus lactis]|nr:hypothetical protein [Lactococcus lactis]
MILCYNIVGMIVVFHPISRVKLLFGAAFLFSKLKLIVRKSSVKPQYTLIHSDLIVRRFVHIYFLN